MCVVVLSVCLIGGTFCVIKSHFKMDCWSYPTNLLYGDMYLRLEVVLRLSRSVSWCKYDWTLIACMLAFAADQSELIMCPDTSRHVNLNLIIHILLNLDL